MRDATERADGVWAVESPPKVRGRQCGVKATKGKTLDAAVDSREAAGKANRSARPDSINRQVPMPFTDQKGNLLLRVINVHVLGTRVFNVSRSR